MTHDSQSGNAATKPFVIASLFPQLMNTNGDAANARVLARRATWKQITDTELVEVHHAPDVPGDPDIIVVGSCGDADRAQALAALQSVAGPLRQIVAAGVPLIAVGVGWELLSKGFETADGTAREGLGIFPGRAILRAVRVSDDLVIESQYGRLIGYENHSSDYLLGADDVPLGRVLYGSGNGGASSSEGVVAGNLFGTHLHGPVLAKNPVFADHLLTMALARSGRDYDSRALEPAVGLSATTEAGAARADAIALAARDQITARLGL